MIFFTSCTQPSDPSYRGPKVNLIRIQSVVLVNQPCSIKVEITDEKHSTTYLRWRSLEDSVFDTTSWYGSFPTNTVIYTSHIFTSAKGRFVELQAKGLNDETSNWSEQFFVLSSDDSVYFHDNFQQDSTTPDTSIWTYQTYGEMVISVDFIDTTKALLLYDPLYSGSWGSLYATAPLADSGTLSLDVLLPPSSSNDSSNIISFRSLACDFNWDKIGLHFGIVGDSLSYKSGTIWTKLSEIPKNQWVNLKISFNSIEKRYHIYQDDSLIYENISFDGSGEFITYFQILCPDNAYRDSIWIDNINFLLE